jgi:hypothetical protein
LCGRLADDHTPFSPLQRAAFHALAASETLVLQSLIFSSIFWKQLRCYDRMQN